MINLNDAAVTEVQFFDTSYKVQINEEGDYETIQQYSANVIINNCLVIQLSGNQGEAHKPSIPSADECYYNNEEIQDWASENLDVDDVVLFLDENDIENNYYFLSEK